MKFVVDMGLEYGISVAGVKREALPLATKPASFIVMREEKLSLFLSLGSAGVLQLAFFLLLSPAFGCANPLRFSDGNIEHLKHRYQVSVPHSESEVWKRVDVPGAGLSFVSSESGSSVSLLSSCPRERSQASLEVVARQLLIGLRPDSPPRVASVSVDGEPGIVQIFTTREGDTRVTVKAVTTGKANCQYDFILAAPGNFEVLEADFDRWWQGARLLAEEGSK